MSAERARMIAALRPTKELVGRMRWVPVPAVSEAQCVTILNAAVNMLAAIQPEPQEASGPIPLIMICPSCGRRHVEQPLLYQDVNSGIYGVRRHSEFYDGRFEAFPAPPATATPAEPLDNDTSGEHWPQAERRKQQETTPHMMHGSDRRAVPKGAVEQAAQDPTLAEDAQRFDDNLEGQLDRFEALATPADPPTGPSARAMEQAVAIAHAWFDGRKNRAVLPQGDAAGLWVSFGHALDAARRTALTDARERIAGILIDLTSVARRSVQQRALDEIDAMLREGWPK